MDSKIEQRIIIKCLLDSDEKPANIFLKLKKMFRNKCVLRARVFEWACPFKEGRRPVYDDERPGAPVTVTMNANVNRLRALLITDRHLTTLMLLVGLGINCEMVRQLLTISYTCENYERNSFQMHRHIHLSRYANIWWKNKFPHCRTHHTASISPPATFFCSPNSSRC